MDEDVRRKVEKHDRDLYQGSGKDNPSLTTRMAMNEMEINTVKDDVTEIKDDNKAMKRMLIGLILTVAGEIVVKLVMK